MLKFFTLIFFIAFSINAFCQQTTTQKIIVKFKKGATIDNTILKNVLLANNCKKTNSLFPITDIKNSNLKSLDLVSGQYFFEFNSNAVTDNLVKQLQQTNLFDYVEKDQIGFTGGQKVVTPNDTYFNRQWGLNNDGTFDAIARLDADVDMVEAWERTTGSASTIVCVLDGGVKLDHPEFAGRLWVNNLEIANNNIDDDGNGYIDDVNGWDWVNDDKDPTDDNGHGTNVAGIIGAKASNSLGYAGVDWNCKLMIGKVTDAGGSGWYVDWISGIYYAVAKGAKVINMSLGGSGSSQAMKDACDFAYNNNVTILACMMNTNNNTTYYPAGFSSTIAVGATNTNDARVVPFPWSATSGSNYGSHIEVVAPGNNVYGLNHLSNTEYNWYWSGTSQATPLVAGIVSLMYALKPSITPAEVKTILYTTSQDMVGSATEDIAGFDNYMGYGRVNALAALSVSTLPLKQGILTGKIIDNKINLFWNTQNEFNIDYFEMEYSADFMQWNAIGTINSRGNSTTTQNYSFNPLLQPNGTLYFRLKTFEKDGTISISNICKLVSLNNDLIKLKSTVVANSIFILSNFTTAIKLKYKIVALNGQTIVDNVKTFEKGILQTEIKLNNLAVGLYAIAFTNENGEAVYSSTFLKH